MYLHCFLHNQSHCKRPCKYSGTNALETAKCCIHVIFLTTRNQRLRGNCFDLAPCSTRETTLKAKLHQSPELTTTLSEYELSLYELPTPSNKRVMPYVTLLKVDLESSFVSVKESFNFSTVLANQTGCKRKVGEWILLWIYLS